MRQERCEVIRIEKHFTLFTFTLKKETKIIVNTTDKNKNLIITY